MPYKDPAQQRAYQREWMARRRAAWLAENGPCVDCGSWDDLQVDHIDPQAKVSHRVWNWADARRLAELAKCAVRCRQCHDEKTNEQGRRKRFCKRGHDTWIDGRDSEYRCHQCRVEFDYPAHNARRRAANGS